jgi:hypothetical protein
MKERGFDMVSELTVERRLEAQKILLDHHCEMIKTLPRPFITDRSPIDMAAYMLCEIAMKPISQEFDEQVRSYVSACVEATVNNYGVVVAVRPLPDYVVEEGKVPPNRSYQLHHQAMVEGLMSVYLCHVVDITASLRTTDLQSRVTHTKAVIERYYEGLNAERAGILLN